MSAFLLALGAHTAFLLALGAHTVLAFGLGVRLGRQVKRG